MTSWGNLSDRRADADAEESTSSGGLGLPLLSEVTFENVAETRNGAPKGITASAVRATTTARCLPKVTNRPLESALRPDHFPEEDHEWNHRHDLHKHPKREEKCDVKAF